ncbi:FAD-dependent monooxygenase [Novosphingobium sp.]|uniref:FAD-dependent monooxygenase n=1 Tax=Novosphingobium sp. TaxID=1874826 RepID=UPI002B494090|nr:FAD-dependent monooxygenase [Novosphingobium sp.]HKR92259.1 FAD-dependent monooxygenase [Novosphingobium sp.]
MIDETYVLIIGGGPVGLTLAIDLGKRGVPTIVVNEHPGTARHPKCNMVNGRTMEHYRRLGVADAIRAVGHASDFPRAVAYRTRFCGFEIGRIDLSFLAQAGWPGPENPCHVSQIDIEPVLKEAAERQPAISVRFGWKATSLRQTDEGVEAAIEEAASGERRTVRARYAVGCDGARSTVRDLIGTGMVGEDGTAIRKFVSGTMIAYYFRSDNLLQRAGHEPALMTWIMNHDARGYVMTQSGGNRFVAHFQVPGDIDWQTVESADVLERMLGPGINYEIISQGPWTGGLARVAEYYAKGDIFIAGDAAHLFTPLGGFGLNTGVGDVINLGWKLAAAYDGWAGPGLLATYHDERQPIGWRNTRLGVACAARKDGWEIPQDIEEDTPQAEAKRKALGAHVEVDDLQEYATIGVQLGERYVSPVIAANAGDIQLADLWDRYIPSDQAGGRAPHFYLPDGRSLYDALGEGFILLAFGGEGSEPLEQAALARGVPLTVVRLTDYPADYHRALVLIRPDHQIAWSGDTLPSDPLALVDQIRGAWPVDTYTGRNTIIGRHSSAASS